MNIIDPQRNESTAGTSSVNASLNEKGIDEERIRALAYQIWETEGRPDGQEHRHWELAHKLASVEAREEPPPATPARRARKPQQADVIAADIAIPVPVVKTAAASRKPRTAKRNTPKQDA